MEKVGFGMEEEEVREGVFENWAWSTGKKKGFVLDRD